MRAIEYLVVKSLVNCYDLTKADWTGAFHKTKFTPTPAGLIVHHSVWNWEFLAPESSRCIKRGRFLTGQLQKIVAAHTAGANDEDTDKELLRTSDGDR